MTLSENQVLFAKNNKILYSQFRRIWMSQADKEYAKLADLILSEGVESEDRTGTGTYSVFGTQSRYDLSKEFPLLTTKKLFWKGIIEELLWMLRGSTDVKELKDKNVHIWDEWEKSDGTIGPGYGKQWRRWAGEAKPFTPTKYSGPQVYRENIDQIQNVINNIKTKPYDRGHIVSAWNVADLPEMALRPCHTLFQFYVRHNTLSCQLYQRSGDVFLGIPFNIASYALLTHMIAQVCHLQPGTLVHTIGDAHIYKNHVDVIKEQLARNPDKPGPIIELNKSIMSIDDFKAEDIKLLNYNPDSAIKAPVSV
jgi:thymidylate synthase